MFTLTRPDGGTETVVYDFDEEGYAIGSPLIPAGAPLRPSAGKNCPFLLTFR